MKIEGVDRTGHILQHIVNEGLRTPGPLGEQIDRDYDSPQRIGPDRRRVGPVGCAAYLG